MSLKSGTHNKPKAAMTIMEKRLPQNPKYKDTQSKLDTGSTVNNVRLICTKEFLKRRDETFRRVTPRCLAELFAEYEDTGKGDAAAPEMVARMVKNADGEFVMERQVSDDNQEHAGPRVVSYDAEEGENYDVPYLILDTRPREDFTENRIHRCLMEYAALYPHHVEGTPPPRPKARDAKKPARDLYKSGTALIASSAKSVAGSTRKKLVGDDDVSSVASHQSVAESVISKATQRKSSVKHGGSGSRGGNANSFR
ncbi:hypothetical protein DYB30_004485 [Aphanomyces astaci]|uniref:Rhodanese domain-containing protein n=1 Tax=Aphanomyces astaci TaxID=112090 RepID=A0A397E8K6_APHAT|nr:hypothetical protein DYB30_004485 [Aphanomyces astaci]